VQQHHLAGAILLEQLQQPVVEAAHLEDDQVAALRRALGLHVGQKGADVGPTGADLAAEDNGAGFLA